MIDAWQEVRLDEVAKVIISNVDKKSKPGEKSVRLCNYLDVYNNNAVRSNMPFMTATATDIQIQKFGLRVGDVVITKDSETPDDIAVSTFVESATEDLVCGYHLAIIRTNQYADGHFLKYCFDLPQVQHYFGSRASGATRFGLTKQSIEHAIFKLPKLNEQRRIVEILKTWDEEIEAIDVLRTTWICQKQGLMQVLLTGKFRFAEFKNKWTKTCLGDLANVSMGASPKSESYNTENIGLPLIQGNTDILDGYSMPRLHTSKVTKICQPGDILLSVRAPVGTVAISAHEACVGRGMAIIKAKSEVDQNYLHQLLVFNESSWKRVAQGSTFSAINFADIDKFHLMVPAFPEQRKIVDILKTWDRAIEKLHGLRIAKINQKRGLMQKLLTGKIQGKT